MLNAVANKIFGTSDEREVKKLMKKVEAINALEPKIEKLTDFELKGKTEEFKIRFEGGEDLDDILPEAFAVAREGAKRVLRMRHYDVQLIGGMILHSGRIAEMKTGEGKTLMATLAIYLNALTSKGVHIITVNDYLAQRDMEIMRPLYNFLGLSVGVIVNGISNEDRKRSYASDITYGTNNEFGFDYLRDNMVHNIKEKVQRVHHYAIVDEIDSILIDEARTPLIISGAAEETTHWYNVFAKVVLQLKRSLKTEKIKDKKNTVIPEEDYEDYEVDEKQHNVTMTEKGIKNVERILNIENLYSPEHVELTHFLAQALKAKELFKLDRDYIINEDDEVIIVDEFTGRLMEGRRYSDGLHQAIEAKENLEVAGENQTLATITLQNYFRMYEKLSGMTGTAKTEEDEFKQIYKLGVVAIPTNKPVIRKDFSDVIYITKRAKYDAIVEKIKELYENGQPVLVGTASIQNSEDLSKLLKKARIPHDVLNAKQHTREAEIIAQAGRYKAVTIATNMAGRGTDIKLGGDPESLALKTTDRGTPEFRELVDQYQGECEENKEKVVAAGGLFILGTERHESRRIDNQLRGRAGRQGDPGASEFYLSLEDDLMRLFGGDRLQNMMASLKVEEHEEIRNKFITRAVEGAQKRVESRNFSIRKNLLEYDDINNKQREVVYAQRDLVLRNEDLKDLIISMLKETVEDFIDNALSGDSRDDWNFDYLVDNLRDNYNYHVPELYLDMERNKMKAEIIQDLLDRYNNKEREIGSEQFRDVERYIMLEVLDQRWRENLKNLTELREGIYLRSYGQKNPINEYKIISTDLYNEMIDGIKREVSSFLMKLRFKTEEEMEAEERAQGLESVHQEIEEAEEVGDALEKAESEMLNVSRKKRRELERQNHKGRR